MEIIDRSVHECQVQLIINDGSGLFECCVKRSWNSFNVDSRQTAQRVMRA